MDSELLGLVVRISADAAQYQSALRGAVSSTQTAAASVAAAGAKVEGFGRSLQGFAGQVGAALAAITAGWVGGSTFGILERWFFMFAEGESTLLRLRAAVEGNGGAVEETLAAYKDFAASVAAVTTTSKGGVASLLQMAETYGVTGAAAEQAVKNAIAYEAATGRSAQGMIRITAMMAQGNARMVGTRFFLPQLQGLKDPVEKLAKAQEILNKQWAVAQAEAKGAGGAVKQLQNAWSSLQRQFGGVVAEAVKPVVQVIKDVVDWVGKLPAGAKTAAVVIAATAAAMVTAFAAVTAAIIVAGIVFNTAFGGIGIIVGLIVTGIVGAAGGVAGLVAAAGGLGPVFASIKKWAEDAWAWVKPVVYSVGLLIYEFSVDFVRGVQMVSADLMDLWRSISGDSKASFTTARDGLRDFVIFGAFALSHAKEVADYLWEGFRLGELVAFEELKYGFLVVLPTVLMNFSKAVRTTLSAVAVTFGDAFRFVVENAAAVFLHLHDLITGAMKFEDVMVPFKSSVVEAWKDVAKIPPREMGQLEKQMRAQFEAHKKALGVSFESYRQQKLKEFDAWDKTLAGKQGGKKPPPYPDAGAVKEATKELGKWDAALVGSVEAAGRLAEYRAALAAPLVKKIAAAGLGFPGGEGEGDFGDEFGAGGGGAGGGGGAPVVVPVAPAAPPAEAGQAVVVLKEIRGILTGMALKQGVTVAVAGANG